MEGRDYAPDRIYRNILTYFPQTRNYTLIPNQNIHKTEKPLIAAINDDGFVSLGFTNNNTNNQSQVLILGEQSKYIKDKNEQKKLIRAIIKSKDFQEYIIIVQNENYGRDTDNFRNIGNKYAEIFPYANFIINIPEHYCSQLHKINPDNEQFLEYLEKNRITVEQLPKIHFGVDPQLAWIWSQPGDIIHIERKNETTIISNIYRLVIIPNL